MASGLLIELVPRTAPAKRGRRAGEQGGGTIPTRSPHVRARFSYARAFLTAGLCAALVACTATKSPQVESKVDPELGVVASPRVVADGQTVPRGGGRYQVGKSYQIAGKWYTPKTDPGYDRVGLASWYGGQFHGRLTANGEVFDSASLSAAHPTLPLPSYVRVTNLNNDRSIIVRVNDRGPYSHSRLIDVSERTAEMLGFKRNGTAKVRVQYVDRGRIDGDDQRFLLASYRAPDAAPKADANVMLAAAEPRRRPSKPAADDGSFMVAAAAPGRAKTSLGRRPSAAPAGEPVVLASAAQPATRPLVLASAESAAAPARVPSHRPRKAAAPAGGETVVALADVAPTQAAPAVKPRPAAPAAPVAFTGEESNDAAAGALQATKLVSAPADADARISMAFASLTDLPQ